MRVRIDLTSVKCHTSPAHLRSYAQLCGIEYFSMNRIERIQNMLEQDPKDTFLLFALAKELENINEYESSRKTYDEVLSIDPEYIGAYYHLGKMLLNKEAFEQASQYIQKGIEVATQKDAQKDLRELRELQAFLPG